MKRLLGCIVCVALGSFEAAHATAGKLEPPDLSRFLRWGPFRVRPAVEVRNFGYDDNILLRDEPRISDVAVTFGPRVDGLLLFGDRAFLTFSERLDYTAYKNTSEQNFWNHRGSGRLTVPLGRMGVIGELGLADVRERPVDRDDIRPERREERYGAGLVLELGWRTDLELTRSRIDYRYRDDDFTTEINRLDRVEDLDALEARYRLLGRTRLTLELRRKEARFGNAPERDARETTLLPGIDLGLGGRVAGRFRLGWSRVDARTSGIADFQGVIGDARLSYRAGARTTVRLEFEREQGFSVSEVRRYYRSTEVELKATRFLNRIVGVELAANVGELTFQEGPGLDREDDVLRYHAGLRLRLAENDLGRKIDYLVKVGEQRRDSTDPTVENERFLFGIDAVVGF